MSVATVPVPDLGHVFPLPNEHVPDHVSTVTLTLPDPVVTCDEYRLQILSKTWTRELAEFYMSGTL